MRVTNKHYAPPAKATIRTAIIAYLTAAKNKPSVDFDTLRAAIAGADQLTDGELQSLLERAGYRVVP